MNPYLYCTGSFTSLNNDIIRRSIYGGSRPSWALKSVVPDFLLETFECARDDRHMLYNDDLQDCPGYQCRFCPENSLSHIAIIAKEDGRLLMMDTNISGSSAIINSYKAHNNCIFDIQWLGRDNLLTCSGDSSVRYHDLETSTVISRFTSHTCSVKALSLRPGQSSQFVSCARDGAVLLWDLRQRATAHDNSGQPSIKAVTSIHNAHHNDLPASVSCRTDIKSRKSVPSLPNNTTQKTVTSVVFVDDNVVASSGCSDGKIKFWDVRKLSKKSCSPVKEICYPSKRDKKSGYTDLIVNRSGTKLFASCMDSYIYEYDLGRHDYSSHKYRYTGHNSTTFYLKMDLSPDENYIVCGSSTFSPYIYRVGVVPQRPVILNGHQGEVTVCRWCPSNEGTILSISDDCTAMIHRMKPSSSYNVFYRHLTRTPSTGTAPIGLSARAGEETVKLTNQNEDGYTHIKDKHTHIATASAALQLLSTPKKMKNQSISSFMSPVTVSLSPALATPLVPVQRTLSELSNTHMQLSHTKAGTPSAIKRSLSAKKNDSKKRGQPHDSTGSINTNNKENIKRRKTVIGQSLITNFLRPSDNS